MEPSSCICNRLRRATRDVTQMYDAAFEPYGLNVAQHALLNALRNTGTPTITELAATTRLDSSTLGRNLRVLERAGHVEFLPGSDRRTRRIGLTDEGRATLDAAFPAWKKTQSLLAEKLGPNGEQTLFNLLSSLGTS